MGVTNFIRTQLGFPERTTDKPILEQIEDEEDQAWTPLRGIGLYPAAFLPEDDSWMDEYCPRSGGTELGVAGTSQVGLTIPDYVHTQLGFDLRFASNLGTEERDREEDDAWDRLYGFWLNPKEYFLKG